MKTVNNRLYLLAVVLLLATGAVSPALAGLIGGNIYVSGGGCRFPDVAYDSVDGKYLVVWPDYNYSPGRIFGRFVSNAGANIGNVFQISDGTVYGLYPTLAYNSTNNEFLVTWDDGRGPDKIAGQRIRGSDGALLGGNFTIGTTSGGRSSVAWSPTSNCYYVVYYLAAGNVDVFGQRVSNTGALLGSELNISNDVYYSGYPSVGYGSSGNQFLVTWDYAPSGGYIRGQRIDAATGAMVGGAISVTSMGYEDRSSVAYDTVNNRFMVQSNEQGYGGYSYDQFGQLVNTDGTLYGGAIPIAHTAAFEGETLLGCDVAYTGGAQRYFSIFQVDSNMAGQEVLPSGALPAGPVTLGTNTGGHGGVAADTSLNRFLTVWESWEGSLHYVRAQLYEANSNPAPGPVANFVASSGNGQNNLTWTNPVESDFTGTLIRFRTDTYPTSPTDGTLLVDKAGSPGANDSQLHGGLTNGVTYYYTAWAHDSTPNYSLSKTAYGLPTAPVCFSDAFAYADGNLNGNGGWSGSAGSNIGIVSQTVKIIGGLTAQDAIHTTSCGDPGSGYITVTVKVQGGVGTDYMWDLWIDDTANLNLARWYGAGTTARGRIGGTASVTATQTLTGGWDELKVKIDPYANTTEFFFNGGSIGVLDHGQTGAGNIIGRLRFTRGTSTAVNGNYLFFDDLTIGNPQDTTPPGPATNFVGTGSDQQANLSWTNPTDSDFTATMIRFRNDTYPTSPSDGTLVIDKTNTPGSNDSHQHTGLTNGLTYYYSAFAHDAVPNYSSAANTNAVPADTTPPGPVTGFTAIGEVGQNELYWTNPGGDFTGTKIMWKTTGYPTGPTDGSMCYDGALTGYYHTGLTPGVTYYYCAYAHDEVPNYASAAQANATPTAQAPYAGVIALPGTVQAENFDEGGEGIAYHDLSAGNLGGAYRTTDVDIETTGDTGGGYNVGWIDTGEWLEYTVNVASAGLYELKMRTASPNAGCSAHIEMNGLDVTGVRALPNTGAWQTYATTTFSNISLNAGEQILRVYIDGGSFNFNYLDVVASVNNAQYISDTIPNTMTAGQQYSVNVTMKNIGTTTWSYDGGYKLGGVGDSDPFADTRQLLNVGETVAPQAQRTFTFTMTAPTTPGQYTTDWRMLRESVEWFGDTLTEIVQVNPATVTISNSGFDADAQGWTISTWRASTSYGYGVMAWDATSGNPGGDMRCTGNGSSNNNDRCTREGGEIKKTISTSGYSNIKVTYDLRVNSLGTAKTGTGTGSCAVDHNLIDEQLTVFYSTNGGSSWTEAEYMLRATLLNYQSWGTRTVDLTGVPAVNNNPNFTVRFRWQVNQGTDVGYLDNIKVTSN
ncbi:MAG: DUF5010 C-terminal domain-containing protein [Armatimonadota bacterium]|nr:DUF5010 C-terminal domain-containing protein [Armatimonadota bacterium]